MPKNIPDGVNQPQDRLVAESEALDSDQPMTFEFKGATFQVLPALDWDKSAIGALNSLDINGWARGALVPADVARFIATPATVRESVQFVKHVGDSVGVDPGELFAS